MRFQFIKYFLIIIAVFVLIIYLYGGGFGNNKNKIILNKGKTLIFAHRGVPVDCVENSINSFDKAIDLGFEAIETDLAFTKDKKIIVFHDLSGNRLLKIDSLVRQMNFKNISSYNLYLNGIPTDSKIISFEDLLIKYNNNITFYLDIKDVNFSIANKLKEYINKYKVKNTVLVADSHLLFLAYMKLIDRNIVTVLEDYSFKTGLLYRFIPKKFKPDYCATSIKNLNKKYIYFLKANDYYEDLIVWGVNSGNIENVKKLGIKNLIFDYYPPAIENKDLQKVINNE